MPPKDTDDIKALESLVQTASALLTQLQAVLSEIHKAPDSASASSSSPSPEPTQRSMPCRSPTTPHPSSAPTAPDFPPDNQRAIHAERRVNRRAGACRRPYPRTSLRCRSMCAEAIHGRCPQRTSLAGERVLSELQQLLQKIPNDGKILSESKREGFAKGEKGSLPATGLLWSACDNVIDLSKMGVGGFFIQKVDQWRDILNDVMEEMKEWGDEEPDSDSDSDPDPDVNNLADQLGSQSLSAQAMLDSLMNSHQTIPSSDPDRIRPRLETSLKRLRLVTLLYQALTKRRLKKLPALPPQNPDSSVPSRLDEMAKVLAKLPDSFGDLACAFYELQPSEIDKTMDQCFLDAFAASELFAKDWQDGRDAFSEWRTSSRRK